MKPSTPFLAFLLSVLFAAEASEIILDVDGHPVQNDGKYYLFADGRAIINSTNYVVSALVYPGSPITVSTLINIPRPSFVTTGSGLSLRFTDSPDFIWAVMPSSHMDKPIVAAKLTDPHYIRAGFALGVHDAEKFEYTLGFPATAYNNVVSRGNGEKFGEYENFVVTGNKNEAPAVFKFKKVEDDIGLSMVV